MRPLAGPWLSVSISPALRSGHKGHTLGPFTATAQMLGSICYSWGQRSPVNFWFHSIHQLYGHGASGRIHMQGITGGHGSSDCLTGPLHSPADRGSEDSSAFTSLKNELSRGQRCGEWWVKSDWMNEWCDEHWEIWIIDSLETEARTETEMSFLVKLINILYVYVGNYRVQTCIRWLIRLPWCLYTETVN